MPSARIWTSDADATLRDMLAAGQSFDDTAAALGIARWTAVERARRIGARRIVAEPEPVEAAPDDPWRAPLPAGHPVSWGPISQGREWST
jgi:hypothetical protein